MSDHLDDHLDKVAEILGVAWDVVLEGHNLRTIKEWGLDIEKPDIEEPAVESSGKAPWGLGIVPFVPPGLDLAAENIRAILNREQCDHAPQIMARILLEAFKGAQFKLLTLAVRPEKAIPLFKKDVLCQQDAYIHTVVTVKFPGPIPRWWVLDLTRSQFGYGHVWMLLDTYCQRYKDPGSLIASWVPLIVSSGGRARKDPFFEALRDRLFATFCTTLREQGLHSIQDLVILHPEDAREKADVLVEALRACTEDTAAEWRV
ncbi:uncharacterized protein BDZ99DRAFT_524155 [Mytilinidion resinicola]|uniref:Uncharacterized protein n=1 Tax=Mytilinidion resinicola TaxID=574789 RepID=A0A6A6YBB2_9PEZI|nr:uncharacterized protein BDZ99DRAFT_524155 [Mytilinidion resinicola]KAF2805909.1 hypothetical protein BDZ99DRAFT_524155 [Mytilinidion resinicola]